MLSRYPQAKKIAKGMLPLPPEAVMMALDTSGPVKEDVFPTCCPVSAAQRK